MIFDFFFFLYFFQITGFKRIFNKALMETLAHQLVIKLSEEVQLFKDQEFAWPLLSIAAKAGNAEFLIILIRTYPDIMWTTDSNNRSLFHLAVKNRQESVFNLIHEVVTLKEIILTKYDKSKFENILHLAGYLAPPSRLNIVSGAALQMQRELLWFKVGFSTYYLNFFFLVVTLINLQLQNCRK